jgi:hypothetical protein
MSPVNQYGELDAFGPPAAENRFDGSPDRAACVKNVIYQYDVFAVDIKRKFRALNGGGFGNVRQIIAVKTDIDAAAGNGDVFNGIDVLLKFLRQRASSAEDPDEQKILGTLVFFNDLMGDPHQGAVHGGFIHQSGFDSHGVPRKKKNALPVPGKTQNMQTERTALYHMSILPVSLYRF